MTTVTIPGAPVAKQRARTVNGHTYTPPLTRAYEEQVAFYSLQASERFPDGDVRVEIVLASPTRLRGDIDNYAKAVLDGIVKARLIGDDRQIVSLAIKMVKSEQAEARVFVERA